MPSTVNKRRSVDNRDPETRLADSERKFRKSCVQINLLNTLLEETKLRYQMAKVENFHRFRYNLRLKLAVIEGTRNMYYEYAHVQAEVVAALRQELFGEVVPILSGGDGSRQ